MSGSRIRIIGTLALLLLTACNAKQAGKTPSPVTTGSGAVRTETRASLEARAKSGDPAAQFDLGAIYHDGEGVPKDLKLAREWFLKSAKQGDARAQFNLAVMYYVGEGVKQDYAQAKEWFTKSANGGNERGQFNLAVMYYRGEGTKQDLAKALDLFTLSGRQGFTEAQFNVGVMYAKGEGTTQDIGKAYAWFDLARTSGNERAPEVLKNMERELKPDQLAAVKKTATALRKDLESHAANQ